MRDVRRESPFALACRRQLVDLRLQRLRHLVEGRGQEPELVLCLHGHARVEEALGQRPRRLARLGDGSKCAPCERGAHDRGTDHDDDPGPDKDVSKVGEAVRETHLRVEEVHLAAGLRYAVSYDEVRNGIDRRVAVRLSAVTDFGPDVVRDRALPDGAVRREDAPSGDVNDCIEGRAPAELGEKGVHLLGVDAPARRVARNLEAQARLFHRAAMLRVGAVLSNDDVGTDREHAGGDRGDDHEGDREPPPKAIGGYDRLHGEWLEALEPVADSAHGRDELRVTGIVLHLGAEALDGHVDDARVAEVVVVPHAIQERVSGQYLSRVARELYEKVEIGCCKGYLGPSLVDLEARGVDLEFTGLDLGLALHDARRAPQRGADSRHQLGHLERLGDVVVGPELQARDDVDGLRLGREHHDRNLALAADFATDLEAVERRQHDVQDDGVEVTALDRRQRLTPIGLGRDSEAGALEAQTSQLTDGWIVFDDQQSLVHGVPLSPQVCTM